MIQQRAHVHQCLPKKVPSKLLGIPNLFYFILTDLNLFAKMSDTEERRLLVLSSF